VRTQPAAFDAEEYNLFCAYQAAVHGESQQSEAAYTRWLCDSPLPRPRAGAVAAAAAAARPPPFGTYHQQYRLGDRLVAVGVLDMLPGGVSSAYVFYDPGLQKTLQPGKLTALQEISFLASLRRAAGAGGESDTLRWYHLGLFLPGNPKMSYKAAYKPSQLYCPIGKAWVPYEAAVPRLGGGREALTEAAPPGDQQASLEQCLVMLVGPSRGREEVRTLAAAEACVDAEAKEALREAARRWRDALGAVAHRAALVHWVE